MWPLLFQRNGKVAAEWLIVYVRQTQPDTDTYKHTGTHTHTYARAHTHTHTQNREQGKGSARGTAALAPLRCHGRAWRPAVRQRLLRRGVARAASKFTVLEMPSCVLLLQGLSKAGVESRP